MKAIINVKKQNQYAKFNGMQFEVKNTYMCKGVAIYGLIGVNQEYPNNVTEFSEKEVKNIIK